MFLLDTNVLSELRKPKPHGGLLAWYAAHPERHAIASITLFELQAGAFKSRVQDAAKARDIEEWISEVTLTVGVIPLDGPCARETARLLVGRSLDLMEDAIIAATAIVHGLTVATRNTRDFEPFGAPIINPFLFPRQ
jgi:predicted nucleic acid-binding protein